MSLRRCGAGRRDRLRRERAGQQGDITAVAQIGGSTWTRPPTPTSTTPSRNPLYLETSLLVGPSSAFDRLALGLAWRPDPDVGVRLGITGLGAGGPGIGGEGEIAACQASECVGVRVGAEYAHPGNVPDSPPGGLFTAGIRARESWFSVGLDVYHFSNVSNCNGSCHASGFAAGVGLSGTAAVVGLVTELVAVFVLAGAGR